MAIDGNRDQRIKHRSTHKACLRESSWTRREKKHARFEDKASKTQPDIFDLDVSKMIPSRAMKEQRDFIKQSISAQKMSETSR